MLTGCGCYSGFHKGTEVFRSGRGVFESWYHGFSCKRAVCAWLLVRSVVFNRLEGVLSVQLSFLLSKALGLPRTSLEVAVVVGSCFEPFCMSTKTLGM